jgi:uncharacterized protein YkwD
MRTVALALFLLAPVSAAPPADKDKFKLSDDEQALLDRTNAERKAAGVPELKASPKLFAAARGHAANMAKQNVLAHDLDGKTFGDRITAAGYRFASAAENVAQGQQTPKEAVETWMNSPPHKANLLNADYTAVGLAVAANDKGERFWVQVFAAPQK